MKENRFFIVSDPQLGHRVQEERMHHKRDIILREASPKDVLIIPGDLTHKGVSRVSNPFIKYLCMCYCIRKARGEGVDGYTDELERLKEQHIQPIQKKLDKILMCIGNHDSLTQWWIGYNPVYGYVRENHGSLCHKTDVDGIMVYSLSEYPTKSSVDWFKKMLDQSTDKPFIVFFHYNLQGPYSDWWKDKEKDYFYKTIEPHKERCICIAEGHVHMTYVSSWKGIRVVNGAGDRLVSLKVTRNDNNEIINVDSEMIGDHFVI